MPHGLSLRPSNLIDTVKMYLIIVKIKPHPNLFLSAASKYYNYQYGFKNKKTQYIHDSKHPY